MRQTRGKNATEAAVRMGAWWPGITQDVQRFMSKCQECQINRPSLGKTVSKWPDAEVWERLHIDWAYVKDQGNILVIVDAGSGWIEAFNAGNRTTLTVKYYLSQIFARFGIPRTLVSDNGPEFVSGDLKHWCQSMGIQKMESPVYHPRANGLAERAVQTVKKALQAWNPNLNVTFGAFLQRALMTHRNTSKTRGKTPAELLLGRKVRLPSVVDFDLCEPILFKANKEAATIPATFIIRKGLNTAYIQPNNTNRTILVSDNQIARHEEEVKEEQPESNEPQGTEISSTDDMESAPTTSEPSVVETTQSGNNKTRTPSRQRRPPQYFDQSVKEAFRKGGRM